MVNKNDNDALISEISQLEQALKDIVSRATTLTGSVLDAGQAQSIADSHAGADVALDHIGDLRDAIYRNDRDAAYTISATMRRHVLGDIARDAIVDDLKAVVAEAEEGLSGRVGKHRNPYKSFIENGQHLLAAIAGSADLAGRIHVSIEAWVTRSNEKEPAMAQDKETAIAAELQGIGRQLAFLASSNAAGVTGASGTGHFGSVSEQMMSSLDAIGLPHRGVQFAGAAEIDDSRGDLIEGLLDTYREELRDGNPIFVQGRSDDRRRRVPSGPSQILSGAARVAARLVRAEADNILDVLDRLPDMTRFRTRAGVPSAEEARRTVADRFEDIDEVMADPSGINLPRAGFALSRAAKALLDFFDYANLERELVEEFRRRSGQWFLPKFIPRPMPDDDEVGQRRPVVLSEELRFEIAEIADSFVRLAQRVRAPLADSLGTAAGRLEQSLTVANASAYALRDILVRSGSSLPEQDVQFFMSGLRVGVQGVDQWPETATGKKGAKGSHKPVVLTVGQVLDWIMDVSAPYIAASNRSARLEQVDFLILAEELDRQGLALSGICDEGSRLGFAFRLPGPMRQLEELTFHIKTSAHLARELAQASDHRDKTGGQKNDR